jgi:hypothetical protein
MSDYGLQEAALEAAPFPFAFTLSPFACPYDAIATDDCWFCAFAAV